MDAQGVDWQQFCLRGVASATEDGELRAQVIFVGPGPTVFLTGIHIVGFPLYLFGCLLSTNLRRIPPHVHSLLSLKLEVLKQEHTVKKGLN